MASETTDAGVTSTDIYETASFVDAIKAKYIDASEDTLAMGIYGYLSEIYNNTLENTAIMASEYANEAVPTKAKFERNIISHALSLGINSIKAIPAYMDVLICIPETALLANMKNNKFTLDKEFDFLIGNKDTYKYHIDYDIIINHDLLPNGKYIYTAMYDIDGRNQCSDITNPYLPTVGISAVTGTNLVMITTRIRQMEHTSIYKKIIVNNPLETKVFTFSFENQMAYFEVVAVEGTTTHYLNAVYDGLTDTSGNEYCNYMYINSKTIRIRFNRDSYQPRANCDITINVWTTQGTTCNFSYTSDKVQSLTSDRFGYNDMWLMTRPITDSKDGKDKSSIDYIRTQIPKQMLLRGSVTTTRDLNNYFNFLNNGDRRLYFLEKIHNQVERLYYSYLLLKVDNNIVPTNTMDVIVAKNMFSSINNINYVIPPGSAFYYDPSTQKCNGVASYSSADKTSMDSSGFFYMNPFLTLINKNPFFAQYYLTILDYNKTLNFEYINSSSECQFIATKCTVKRLFYTERNTYDISITMEQNVNTDFGLITLDSNNNITQCKVSVYGIVYVNDVAYRYTVGSITDFDQKSYQYTFDIKFSTHDLIDKNSKIAIDNGMYDVRSTTITTGYLPSNIKFKFFILANLGTEYGRGTEIDSIVPNLSGFTLCNIYDVYTGVDLFYDYTDLVTSYTTLVKNSNNTFSFSVGKMPLVRYTYLNTEDRFKSFLKILENNRIYIENALVLLEDSFGVDFKFFNTYGPSNLYNIDEETMLNKTNLSLKFEVKFVMASDSYITSDISTDVKAYLEDINYITDLHMPNLITYITNKYRNQLVYFKFLDMNGYGPVKQSIYKEDIDSFVESTTVPEFLNVNTLDSNDPDITYVIKS